MKQIIAQILVLRFNCSTTSLAVNKKKPKIQNAYKNNNFLNYRAMKVYQNCFNILVRTCK